MPAPPTIVHTPGTCGGRARLDGHRVRVLVIVLSYEHHGLSPEEIVLQLPTLRLAEVHAALGYYYDHRDEIQAEIREEAALAEQFQSGAASLLDVKLHASRQQAS